MLNYFLGLCSGVLLSFMYGIYVLKNKKHKRKDIARQFYKEIEKVKKTISDMALVQDRLNKAQEITKTQLGMQDEVNRPQMNALDGKYKNSLSSKIKDMEDEKRQILQSILDDGFDPDVATINSDSNMEKMKLSEFMSKNFTKTIESNRPKLYIVKKETDNNEGS